jgi:hypothetical protein
MNLGHDPNLTKAKKTLSKTMIMPRSILLPCLRLWYARLIKAHVSEDHDLVCYDFHDHSYDHSNGVFCNYVRPWPWLTNDRGKDHDNDMLFNYHDHEHDCDHERMTMTMSKKIMKTTKKKAMKYVTMKITIKTISLTIAHGLFHDHVQKPCTFSW